jgi:hypothetical protein
MDTVLASDKDSAQNGIISASNISDVIQRCEGVLATPFSEHGQNKFATAQLRLLLYSLPAYKENKIAIDLLDRPTDDYVFKMYCELKQLGCARIDPILLGKKPAISITLRGERLLARERYEPLKDIEYLMSQIEEHKKNHVKRYDQEIRPGYN